MCSAACTGLPWIQVDAAASSTSGIGYVQEEVFLNGAIILPHKEIKETILEPGTIIM